MQTQSCDVAQVIKVNPCHSIKQHLFHPSLQDALDALGYFHLALAAALVDQDHPEDLYVVYMKLAEIHYNHMPDTELCQTYRDRARSLKRVLAREDGSSVGENVMTEPGRQRTEDMDVDVGQTSGLFDRDSILDSIPEDDSYKVELSPRSCLRRAANKYTDGTEAQNHRPAGGPSVDGCETDTIASRSYSDSILTGSFDTAKEQISDTSSSTDTYQNPSDGRDTDHTCDITGRTDASDTDMRTADGQPDTEAERLSPP